ncbi:MAG: hypothetical protein ABIA77_07165, partial [Candidatus Omnitrophota bacterium]
MKKIILCAVVVGVFFANSGVFAEDASIQSELDFTRKAVKDGFYDLAESKLNFLLARDIPDDVEAEARFLLGMVYYEKKFPAR